MNPILVLIHSPLVGPFTWTLVLENLREKGLTAILPVLISPPISEKPYWKLHAEAVAQALREISTNQPVVLAGHSGAGPLLPAIRQVIPHPVAGYLFVDAGWPTDDKSRLDLFENPAAADQFRQNAQAGFLPTWSEADLAEVIPDPAVLHQFIRELRPLPFAVYEEALPVFPGWPDAPCGYLRFGDNPAYDHSFAQAQQCGCPRMQLHGEHFHMLVNPEEVTQAILHLSEQMGIPLRPI